MIDLSLKELLLGFADLATGSRRPLFEKTHAFLIYAPRCARLLAELKALPLDVLGLPLVELLQDADLRRDGLARALYLLSEAVMALPSASDALKHDIAPIRSTYVRSLAVVREPYGVAAQSAKDLAPTLDTHRAALQTIPTPDGRTLDLWVADFLAAGQEIGALLSDRSKTLGAAAGRGRAGVLRNEIIATVNEIRAVIATERAERTDLPATLDGDLFGQFDELQRLAEARRPRPAKPNAEPGDPGTPPTTP